MNRSYGMSGATGATGWHAPDELVGRYTDGSLPDADAWSLEKHLERCGACAARVSAAVRRSPAAGPVLAAIREAVLREATPSESAVQSDAVRENGVRKHAGLKEATLREAGLKAAGLKKAALKHTVL